jgi:hypothetical protein
MSDSQLHTVLNLVFFPLILKLFIGLVISKLADQSCGKAKESQLSYELMLQYILNFIAFFS